jgi:hypothetical protein
MLSSRRNELDMFKTRTHESRVEADSSMLPFSRDVNNLKPATGSTDSLCWYMLKLKRDRQFWEDKYRAEAKARLETHDIQRHNRQVNEQARRERERRVSLEKELAVLQRKHKKAMIELEIFRTDQSKYVVQHIAPAHWRQDLLEEQNQNLSTALDSMTDERDALKKEREMQERTMEAVRKSLAKSRASLASHKKKAELAKNARLGLLQDTKQRHTIAEPQQRRASSFSAENV